MLPVKKRKIAKIGNSFYLRLPTSYISNGLVSLEKEYDIIDIVEHQGEQDDGVL